ncbi:MAG TPA: hypothetical protein DCZ75_18640 [Geobacter sp.]|nr:hypothetical protein [Geobacter sp.]
MIRTNIMLTNEQHALLKVQSRLKKRTVGDLVRSAVDTAFPADSVQRRHQIALCAYQEGLISIGKLAESLGLDPVTARGYLREQGIEIAVQDATEALADAGNA